jgi:hypothetical protein
MPDMTQAVPGLLAQVHPAHTHSHDIMAYVTELEYRVSSLEQAIVGLVGGGQQKLNAQPDHAPDPFPEGEGFGGLDPLRTDDYLQQPTNLDPTQKGYGDPQKLQAENVPGRQGYGVPQTNEGAPGRQQDARTAFGGQITHNIQNDPAHPTDVRRAPREGA